MGAGASAQELLSAEAAAGDLAGGFVKTLVDEVQTLRSRLAELERGEGDTSASGTRMPPSSPSQPAGICQQSTDVRARFMESQWLPFVKDMRTAMMGVHERSMHSFSPDERMPPQDTVDEFATRCHKLTQDWYGHRGNVSAVYEWMMKAAEVAHESKYPFEAIPCQRSADGWTRVLDGEMRKRLYVGGGVKPSIMDTGDLPQLTGESPIDNTTLPNIMTPLEAKVLLAGGHVRFFVMNTLRTKQRLVMNKVGKHTRISQNLLDPQVMPAPSVASLFGFLRKDLEAMGSDATATAAATAAATDGTEHGVAPRPAWQSQESHRPILQELKIDPTSLSYRLLEKHGHVTTSWGQLDEEDQHRVHMYLKTTIVANVNTAAEAAKASAAAAATTATTATAAAPGEGHEDEMVAFIAWTKSHPGKFYKDDKALHKQLLLMGMWR